jgi:hypothetical protein
MKEIKDENIYDFLMWRITKYVKGRISDVLWGNHPAPFGELS